MELTLPLDELIDVYKRQTEYNNQQQHLQNDEYENGSGLTLHDLLQMCIRDRNTATRKAASCNAPSRPVGREGALVRLPKAGRERHTAIEGCS